MSELEEGELTSSEDETSLKRDTNGQPSSHKDAKKSDAESGEISDDNENTAINYDDEDVSPNPFKQSLH